MSIDRRPAAPPRLASRGQDGRGQGVVRALEAADSDQLRVLLDRSADAYCVVAERLEAGLLAGSGAAGPGLGGQVWGWFEGTELKSAIYVGANLIPIETTAPARVAFARRLARAPRTSSAVVGFRDQVLDLWDLLEPWWGPARDVREDQPLLATRGRPLVPPDSLVVPVTIDQLDALLPAAVAMFEEEVGLSPVAGGREEAFRARLGATVRGGRAYARIRDGQVLFKAEIGAASRASCQVQGVWVATSLRGAGMAAPGMAAVVAAAARDHAPSVTLYANSHNVPALRCYARVGFEPVGTFATILF